MLTTQKNWNKKYFKPSNFWHSKKVWHNKFWHPKVFKFPKLVENNMFVSQGSEATLVAILFTRLKGWNALNFDSYTRLILGLVMDFITSLAGLNLDGGALVGSFEQSALGLTGCSPERLNTMPRRDGGPEGKVLGSLVTAHTWARMWCRRLGDRSRGVVVFLNGSNCFS